MISGLLAGTLIGTPVTKTARSGNPYLTAKLRIPTKDGEVLWVHAVAFSTSAIAALGALEDGDELALTGPLQIKTWTGSDGVAKPDVSVVIGAVMTAYAVGKKRRATGAQDDPPDQPEAETPARGSQPTPPRDRATADGELNDEIPF